MQRAKLESHIYTSNKSWKTFYAKGKTSRTKIIQVTKLKNIILCKGKTWETCLYKLLWSLLVDFSGTFSDTCCIKCCVFVFSPTFASDRWEWRSIPCTARAWHSGWHDKAWHTVYTCVLCWQHPGENGWPSLHWLLLGKERRMRS